MFYIQFFIENQTNKPIKVEQFSKNQIQKTFELNPKKRFFLDGHFTNGELRPPLDYSTIVADSVIITLENGKKWVNFCPFNKTGRYSQCEKTRNLFSKKSYRLIKDESIRFNYFNYVFEFDETDALNAK
jgi:hypothetical protein